MKKVTFRADESLISQARLVARSQGKTLSAVFREWLLEFTAQANRSKEFYSLMRRLSHVNAARHFSRDEMNRR